jgi:prepilin-type processing-associated H-X9-DG protein
LCYGANGGLAWLATKKAANGASWAPSKDWLKKEYRGVMGANDSLSLEAITDGTSHVVSVAEIRSGVIEMDIRGTWAISGAGTSSIWAAGTNNPPCNGPNNNAQGGDTIWGCQAIKTAMGGAAGQMYVDNIDCTAGPCSAASSKSLHDGGVHVLFADGSVHWIGNFIDTTGDTAIAGPVKFSVWDRLLLSTDGRRIQPIDYEVK